MSARKQPILTRAYFQLQRLAVRRRFSTAAFYRAKDFLYPRRRRRLEGLLHPFGVRPGDTVIDCGANVGNVTATLSRLGAQVYAFEPNPHVYPILARRFAGDCRIRCLPVGVWSEGGRLRLYHDTRCSTDPARWAVSSSLLRDKENVDPGVFDEIELIDLAEFVLNLGRRVKLIKLDIEGAEFRVIGRLVDSGAIDCIDYVVAETHESNVGGLLEAKRQLLERIAACPVLQDKIRLDWI